MQSGQLPHLVSLFLQTHNDAQESAPLSRCAGRLPGVSEQRALSPALHTKQHSLPLAGSVIAVTRIFSDLSLGRELPSALLRWGCLQEEPVLCPG